MPATSERARMIELRSGAAGAAIYM